MNEHHHHELAESDATFWGQHRFLLLIAIAIALASILVGFSMALYASSGAAQLDLSRPGYRAISDQVINSNKDFENYPTSGQLTDDAINDFRSLYEKQSTKAKAVDAFNGDPLNPDVLEISAPPATE